MGLALGFTVGSAVGDTVGFTDGYSVGGVGSLLVGKVVVVGSTVGINVGEDTFTAGESPHHCSAYPVQYESHELVQHHESTWQTCS